MTTVLTLKNVGLDFKIRHGLFKTFHHTALKDVSLEVIKGETFGVLGMNGSGKSSLLQILAGLIAPTRGEISLPAGPITRSLLTLGLGFRPDLSGRDNVMIGLVLQGWTLRNARALIPSIEEFADIGKFFDQPVRSYSSGMRARLGFATGMCSKVDILLIDEVLGVGDARFRQKAESAMRERIAGEQTVIFVSQIPAQIATLCDRALWISNSEVKKVGHPQDVANAYTEFVQARLAHESAAAKAG